MGYVYKRFAAAGRFVALLIVISAFGAAIPVMGALKSGKTYVISPAGDKSMALFVMNSSMEDYAPVVLWTNTDVPAQQWRAEKNGDGTFSFKNIYTGKYLAYGDSLVQLAGNEKALRWKPEQVAGGDDLYIMRLEGSDTFLLGAEESNDGARPQILYDVEPGLWLLKETEAAECFTPAVRNEMTAAWLAHHLKERGENTMSFGDGGWWGDAEMLETMLDAYETTGNKEYLDVFTKVFNYFYENVGDDWLKLVYTDRYKWVGHDFNDDVMWMVIASARAYHLTGLDKYRRLAKKNFDAVYKRAYNRWGMLRWAMKSGHPNGTNSCIHGPAEVAACYIARSLDSGEEREKYFGIARDLYEKQRTYLFVESTGQVLDCFTWNDSTDKPEKYNRWVSTYNQGTMLGAAIMLYNRYGDEKYKRDAEKIVACTRRELCDENGIVKVCQTVDGDLCGFKGILMRYLRRYIVEMRHPELASWIGKNAFHAFNNRNSRGVTSSAWLTKSAEDWISPTEKDKDGNLKSFLNQPFGNSTAVSAAANSLLDTACIAKDAYSKTSAEYFDYLRGAYSGLDEDREAAVALCAGNGSYLGFANVDFGRLPAKTVRVNVSGNGTGGAKIELRLDDCDGKLAGIIDVPAGDKLKTVKAKVSPITGTHRVYFVLRASEGFKGTVDLDWFAFTADK